MPPTDGFYHIGLGTGVLNDAVTLDSLGIPSAGIEAQLAAVEDTYVSGSGKQYDVGSPTAEWHLNFITAAQLDALDAFKTGRSSEVYIHTRKGDGTWASYFCLMHWPPRLTWSNDNALDFTLRFSHMVEQ